MRKIHARIRRIIEQLFRDRLPEFYETLAYHFTNHVCTGLIFSRMEGLLEKGIVYGQKAFEIAQEPFWGSSSAFCSPTRRQ